MKKSAAIVLASLFVIGGATGLPAQDKAETLTLTLESAVDLALRQNPFFLAVREKESQAGAGVREAVSRFLPAVSGQYTQNLAEKLFYLEFPSMIPGEPPQRVAIDFTKDYQMALSFSVPLFAGGRLVSGYKQARANLEASRETVRQSEQETIFNVKRSFYGHLLARDFARVASEALELAEKHYANVKNLYEAGMASRFDLLRSEVEAANLRPQVIRAKNGLTVSELALKSALGLDLDTPIAIEGELVDAPLEVDVGQALEEALAGRPELRHLDHQRRMAGEMFKAARGSLLPTLAVGGAYNFWADNFNFRTGTWQNFYAVNLSLSVPLFDGFEARSRMGQARAAVREIEWTRKGLEDAISLEVRQAVLNHRQARETLLSQEKNVEQAREAVRIAELNYTEGLATNLDVSTAQVALSQARTNYSQALYDCVVSQAQLDKALGRGRSESRSL
jgi:outer membrane protein